MMPQSTPTKDVQLQPRQMIRVMNGTKSKKIGIVLRTIIAFENSQEEWVKIR